MPLTITSLFAALLGAWYLVLTVRVILTRRSEGVSLGSGDSKALERRVRAHGNCAEYVPLAIVLLALLELQGTAGWLLVTLGGILLIGRLLHGYALSFTSYSPLRVPGMGLTLLALGSMVLVLLGQVLV
ncbi:MAG: MAPEG family protein [Paracoccaceae bacterium]